MKGRRDLIVLVAATIAIVICIALIGGKFVGSSKKAAPKAVVVKAVNPNFDMETIDRLSQYFTVQFDLKNLGRPDPFAGI